MNELKYFEDMIIDDLDGIRFILPLSNIEEA
jgi:hypothetical protein